MQEQYIEEDKMLEIQKQEKIKKFIEAVKEEPVLWNIHHELYRSTKVKDKIWGKLSKEHGFADALEGKTEWKRLRDIFRDSLKRRRYKNMQPWKYGEEMTFLIPMMSNRKPQHDLSIYTFGQNCEEEPDNENSSKDEDFDPDVDLMSSSVKLEPPVENSILLMDPMDYEETFNEPSEPLQKFFASMYDSTKLLPRTYQLRIKRKIFEAVMSAEEQFLRSQMSQSDFHDVTKEVEANFKKVVN